MTGNHPLFPKLESGARDLDTSITYVDAYKSMEKLLPAGKVKAIGVANFSVPFLQKLLAETSIVPAANQIENHPYLPQQEIVDFCKEKGIHVTAYSPLGSTGSPLFSEEGVVKVGTKHKVGPGAVLLSYHCEFPSCLSPLEHANIGVSGARKLRTRQICDAVPNRREQKSYRTGRGRHVCFRRNFQNEGFQEICLPRFWCQHGVSG